MKYIVLSFFSILCSLNIYAQETTDESLRIDAAFDACIAMRDAVAANDTTALLQSAKELKEAGAMDFHALRCKDDSVSSLNGHLVFDEAFADSLAAGKSVYDKADEMSRTRTHRGQTANGSILTKTCFVKAGKSTKYNFFSKGHQELAVVAENGGLVTMKIHVTNSAGLDVRHDDSKSFKRGLPQRKTSFELPTDRRNTVELEVVNCGKKDISFVVISN